MTAVRYEFDVLERAAGGGSARELAEQFGVTSRTIFRWRANGIPDLQADRAAIAIGEHPAILWPTDW
jgi:FixJ family two-component response regulator